MVYTKIISLFAGLSNMCVFCVITIAFPLDHCSAVFAEYIVKIQFFTAINTMVFFWSGFGYGLFLPAFFGKIGV